jgi:hypothetical protein
MLALGDCRYVIGAGSRGDMHRDASQADSTIMRFARGRCVERRSQTDFMRLLQHRGVLPS